ncbi:hypothetical protein MPER_12176 [Moniliophthora perniciosa FA553]|nr:hypothetical protein MPER_12176 [Moniliophthora perniciosa FA553]
MSRHSGVTLKTSQIWRLSDYAHPEKYKGWHISTTKIQVSSSNYNTNNSLITRKCFSQKFWYHCARLLNHDQSSAAAAADYAYHHIGASSANDYVGTSPSHHLGATTHYLCSRSKRWKRPVAMAEYNTAATLSEPDCPSICYTAQSSVAPVIMAMSTAATAIMSRMDIST